MYCQNCGKNVIKDANYCINCGHKLMIPMQAKVVKDTPNNSIERIDKQSCRCGRIKRNVYKNYKFTGQRVCVRCEKKGYCPVCGEKLRTKTSEQCGNCGSSWRENPPIQNIQTNQVYLKKFSPENREEKIKCPNCKSTQITSHKKGFSGAKALGGAVLTGGIGILAGTIGSNKILLTCLSCGNKFNVGEDFEGLKRKRKQEEEAMKSPMFWILFIGMLIFLIWIMNSC